MTEQTGLQRRSAATTLLALTLVHLPAGATETRVCQDETINLGTFASMSVAPGSSCVIEGVIIEGNLDAIDALDITVRGVEVRGNVKIEGSTGAFIDIRDSHIQGNLSLLDNQLSGSIRVVGRNTVDGNISVKGNSASAYLIGSRESGGNVVVGNLRVKDNHSQIYIAANNNDVEGNIKLADNYAEEDIIIWENRVDGNIRYVNNVSMDTVYPAFANSLIGNRAVGNMLIEDNTTIDPIDVSDNEVHGNLTCRDNNPDEILVVEPNVVMETSRCID